MIKKIGLLLFCVFPVLFANAHVNLISPVGGEIFNAGETVNIQWEIVISHNTENWDLFFSEDGGNTWNPIEMNISLNILSYQWIVPDISTSQGQIRIVMDNVGNDYEDNSENFTITTVTGIIVVPENNGLSIYPNPMTENAIITFANPDSESHDLIFYNSEGRIIKQMGDLTTDRVLFKRNNLVSGLYFYRLISKNEIRATGKIIIE